MGMGHICPTQVIGEDNSEDEVELVEESKPKSWPHTLQDLRNNNNQLIYPRPMLHHPLFPPRFGSQIPPGSPGPNLTFPGWLYRGLHPPPPLPPNYPIGRGHELMRRLCTMNPAFAQSIIEDYIRPQVSYT